jgi:hypothetical protein
VSNWYLLLALPAVIAGIAFIRGLHHFCLWLEERGLLYYKRKSPTSSAASCFVGLQKVLEPQSRYVTQIREEIRPHYENEAPGEGDRDLVPGSRGSQDDGRRHASDDGL